MTSKAPAIKAANGIHLAFMRWPLTRLCIVAGSYKRPSRPSRRAFFCSLSWSIFPWLIIELNEPSFIVLLFFRGDDEESDYSDSESYCTYSVFDATNGLSVLSDCSVSSRTSTLVSLNSVSLS